MALASIQITQGATVGPAGQSLLGLATTGDITLTDNGGAGATSYQWEFLTWPSPLATAPAITNATSQVATVAPSPSFTDGLYVVRLTRVDGTDGTTVDTRFFGVADTDGDHLPSAGVNSIMCNVGGSAVAQRFGWHGTAAASTNSLLDAFLRRRRSREGYSKVSGTDTTFGRLIDKLSAGTNITLTTLNSGANEQIQINAAASGGTETAISPTSLSANQNDYAPTGWSTATHIRLTSSTNISITGFVSADAPSTRYLINVGDYAITLTHQDTNSSAGNRCTLPGGLPLELGPGDVATIWKDPTSNYWRLL